MSLSPKVRNDSIDRALSIMLDQLGANYTDSHEGVFNPADDRFSEIPNSTWDDLLRSRIIRGNDELGIGISYLFTPKGWYEAHDRLGLLGDGSEFVNKLSRVARSLKTLLTKERPLGGVDEHPMTIAAIAEVSYSFLCNVIDSGAIEARFQQVGARWTGPKKIAVHIPSNSGRKINDA